jgi:hypothetical protein
MRWDRDGVPAKVARANSLFDGGMRLGLKFQIELARLGAVVVLRRTRDLDRVRCCKRSPSSAHSRQARCARSPEGFEKAVGIVACLNPLGIVDTGGRGKHKWPHQAHELPAIDCRRADVEFLCNYIRYLCRTYSNLRRSDVPPQLPRATGYFPGISRYSTSIVLEMFRKSE